MSPASALQMAAATAPVADDDSRASGARRFFDASLGAWMVKVFPGEYYVTKKADEVLVTVLGSCVSACIRDPRRGIGGMNHFMLAEGEAGGWGGMGNAARYGNFAMEKLLNELLKLGCARERARDQGVRRRQRHRHAQPDRHRQFRFRDALSRQRRACAAPPRICAGSTRAAFNISRRPDGSFAAC